MKFIKIMSEEERKLLKGIMDALEWIAIILGLLFLAGCNGCIHVQVSHYPL